MPKNESVQKRLQKVRAPRVQMTYDVEIGDAIENKELPFVVGVLGDFGSDPDAARKRLKDRKFVNVDADNFNEVLDGVAPVTNFRVPNHLSDEGGEFAVQLQFRQMEDFRPEAVVQQVAPLKGLLEARSKLADLRNKLAGNDKLEDLLNDVLSNTEKLDSLRKTKENE
jgi:type VI secretion system protein ImpB